MTGRELIQQLCKDLGDLDCEVPAFVVERDLLKKRVVSTRRIMEYRLGKYGFVIEAASIVYADAPPID
jgi:hypothetical protein